MPLGILICFYVAGEETKTEQKGDAPSLLFACACHTFK